MTQLNSGRPQLACGPAVAVDSVQPRTTARPESRVRRRHSLLKLLGRAFATWALILGFAVINGALREGLLLPLLGNPSALIVSGLLLMACIALVTHVFAPGFRASSRTPLAGVGLVWLGLTLVFEFTFGMARGKTWAEIFAAYTFTDGNLWPLVLVFIVVAPALFGLRRKDDGSDQRAA